MLGWQKVGDTRNGQVGSYHFRFQGGPTHPFLVSVTFDNMAGLDPMARALFVLRLRMCVAKATGLE